VTEQTNLPPPDDDARQAIVDALDETLVVEAAAGTGKTTELVRRILRVLATGRARMTGIVAVTFTEKAAGELKLRLREALEKARAAAADADERQRLDVALETLEEAHVNTIHGFCADLLRERPVEASVDPLFTVLTEPQSDRVYARAFRAWLEEALQDPPEGVRRALRRTSGGAGGDIDDGPIDRLRKAGRQLADWRGFDAPWRRPPFDRAGEIERLVSALHHLADLTRDPLSPRDNFHADTAALRRTSQQIRLEQSLDQRDLDGWEARLIDLQRDRGFSRPRKGYGPRYSAGVARADVHEARDTLFAALQQFRRDADADLAACLQSELAGASARYEALKQGAGALDFADLLSRTRDLLVSHEDVRGHLHGKFTHLFVDEFQDTDPVQAEILLLLAADDPSIAEWTRVRPVPGKLFIVGDPKQAIYRFRGADVGTYWQVSRQLAQVGGRVLQLTTSFRGVPGIQAFVNAAFRHEMTADQVNLQAGYVPLSRKRPSLEGQPAVIALPVPRPYPSRGPVRPSGRAIDESLPDAVGAFIAWLVNEAGWHVVERASDGTESQVRLAPRHVALLFRRFVSFDTDVTRPYIEAIEARNIPHLLVGGKAFHGREEVETIRAALSAIEFPDDELSVFATLRGSLFAIEDAHLLEFRHRFGPCHPFRVPSELGGNSGRELALTDAPAAHLSAVAAALRLLQQLHRERNRRPVADTIGRLLTETRAHVGFILRPAGEQALANVLHVAELARQYELGGGISFRGFIDELQDAAGTEAGEAPILEEGSDGVRLMTVHKAKGLEFPVVILADLSCRMNRNDASRHVDPGRRLCAMKIGGWAPHDLHDHEAIEIARDQAEGVRLAYVAATRARDLLVVPAIGDAPWEGGWFSPLNRALYPAPGARRPATRGPGCPAFTSRDSVIARPGDEIASESTVCPGQHVLQPDDTGAAPYSVVWWDPGALALGAEPQSGVRRHDLVVKDVPRHVVADGRSRYDRWHLTHEDARAAGQTPSLAVTTVGRWASEVPAGADALVPDIPVETVDAWAEEAPRPGAGPAFGLLVHAVLAEVPFDAEAGLIEEAASLEARVLGLGEAEARAASTRIAHVLRLDLVRRARDAVARGACRRETAITCTMPDGTLVEGIVDLAFEEDGRWVVVDYKTDAELAADGEARYRRQIGLYAAAIARATGRPASGVLVRV
jgi:ATP-dependent exoDNAse (exonuclease V) beta subunit